MVYGVGFWNEKHEIYIRKYIILGSNEWCKNEINNKNETQEEIGKENNKLKWKEKKDTHQRREKHLHI